MKYHRIDLCDSCGWSVFCGECGNNCCNGTYGEVNGKKCEQCGSAYTLQAQLDRITLEVEDVVYESAAMIVEDVPLSGGAAVSMKEAARRIRQAKPTRKRNDELEARNKENNNGRTDAGDGADSSAPEKGSDETGAGVPGSV